MSDRLDDMDRDLERALVDLGYHLSYPSAIELSTAVRARLEENPARPAARWIRASVRRTLYPVLAALAILAVTLALSPGARSAVASWFHFGGVQIRTGGLPPGPLGHGLYLGERVSLAEAQRRVPFPILVPATSLLGKPNEVYAGMDASADSVSLVYRARNGIPRSSRTGAGLLLTEFQRRFFDAKLLSQGTEITVIQIHGMTALWLTGTPHVLYYVDQHDKLIPDTVRLAGNALIWRQGSVTYRIESQASENLVLQIASSMQPASR